MAGLSVASVTVCMYVCVSTLLKKNDLRYQHQTWYTYTPWLALGMHRPGGQKFKIQGHGAASVGMHADKTA